MNPEPTKRRDGDAMDAQARDAEALNAFWDELVLGQIAGNPPHATSPNEEMVMNLQTFMSSGDGSAEERLRRLVFGSAPEPALATATAGSVDSVRPMPKPRPEPIRPSWSIRRYSSLAAAALIVVLVGTLVAVQSAGIFSRGGNDTPTAIPAAIAQLDATPAALGTPTVNNSATLWTLPFDGTNVEIGASAVSDGALYRLIRSDEFTGVQAVDTATGTEKWRSAQDWSGAGIGADSNGVYFPTLGGVRALDASSGDQLWDITTVVAPSSLAIRGSRLYVWDGRESMLAIETSNGDIAWQGTADIAAATTDARASQPPAASDNGIAAISGTSQVALFDIDGNFTGTTGTLLDPATVEMAVTSDGNVAIAGAPRLETEQPWARKLMLVDPASGSTLWEVDYNALVTGLTVTDSMVMVLADNPGLAMTEPVQLVDAEGTVTTMDPNPYPEQTSPYIYGYFLDTGEMYQLPEGTPPPNWTGRAWIADPGIPSFVALAQGTNGPIGISGSGRLSFFNTESTIVQAVVDLPGLVPASVMSDGPNVYASEEDGTLTALAPVLEDQQPNPVTRGGSLDFTVPLDGTLVDFGGMTYGNGLVYRLLDAGAGREIEAIYASTGQPAWTLPFDWSTNQIVADPGPNRYEQNPTWTGSGNVFAVDAANRLIALDGAGTASWQTAFEQPVVSMVFDAGTLFIWDESGTMTALNAVDGTVLWATSSGSTGGSQTNEYGMPVPVTTQTLVAMVDAEGTLHGFDRSTGEELWSQSGFDGTNSRLVVSGEGLDGQDQWIVILSANSEPDADGNFDLTAAGILAGTGEYRWADYLKGPLVQPVTSDESFVTFIANEAMSGKAVTVTITPVVDAESPNHYVWTASGSSTDSDVPGGQRLFAIDAPTGQIVWIRTTAGPEFTGLVPDATFRRGQALTADGLLVSPAGGNGWIDGEPLDLGGPVLATVSSNEMGAIGSFATLADGTLVSFGGMPFSQQG